MSGSSDDLGSLGPTTPAVPRQRRVARNNKREESAVAGPSSKPATGARRKRNNKASSEEPIEHVISSGNESEPIPVVLPGRGKTATRAAAANGQARGKGKTKATPTSRTLGNKRSPEVMEVDDTDINVIEETQEAHPPRPTAQAPPKTGKTGPQSFVKDSEIEQLRRKLLDVETQRDAFSKQLEELHHIQAAAEEALTNQGRQYEARLDTQELMIKELTSQLHRLEPLMRSGNSSVLQLLTREAADEEKKGVEQEVDKWKNAVKEKEGILKAKDKRIAELEQTEKELRFELKAEIDRSKILASKSSRNPPSAAKSHSSVVGDNPKNAEVISLYEDLTNLLVHRLKFTTGQYFAIEEPNFSCVYTYVNVENQSQQGQGRSLHFTLRFYRDVDPRDPEPPTSPNQLLKMVQYLPHELEKESEDFVARLDFLGECFTFNRTQLPLFLNTLYKNLGAASGADGDEEDEGENVDQLRDDVIVL